MNLRAVFASLLLLFGCAHRSGPPITGKSEAPFRGAPSYLIAQSGNRFIAPGTGSAGSDHIPVAGQRTLPGPRQLEEVRALLAALDAHVAALDDSPRADSITVLGLTIARLGELLRPFSDMAAEVDELRQIASELPTTDPPRLPRVRARMNELTDLLRLQILVGR